MRTASQARGLGRRPALDGLRALAVLSVVGQHYLGRVVPGGAVGVTIFFVLSGFLITCLLLDEWDRRRAVSLPRFWARRALRLLPALVLILAADVVVHLAIDGGAGLARAWAAIWGPLSYATNWLYVFGRRPDELTPLWSLSVEEQFYVLWPLLLLGLLQLGLRGRRLTSAVAAMAFAALVWQLHWWATGGGYDRAYYGTDMRAYQLLAGCVLACAWRTGMFDGLARARVGQILAALSGTGLVLIAFGTRGAQVITPLGAVTTLAAGAVVVALVEARGPLLTVSTSTLAQQVGRMSYGIYLWNFFFLGVLGWSAPYRELSLVFTFAVPAMSYRLVEEPFLRLKGRLAGPLPSPDAPPRRARQALAPSSALTVAAPE